MRSSLRARARSSGAQAFLVLGVLSLLLTACGSKPQAVRRVVPLVPAAHGGGHSWHWTPRCPLAPAAPTGCRDAGPRLGFAQLNGDAWNLGGSAETGSVAMGVTANGSVTIDAALTQAPPCTDQACLAPSANTWVRGYPNVLYGINQCYAGTSPRMSPDLPLPMRVASLPKPLIGTTAYTTEASSVTSDLAYDLWLHPTDTKEPCRTKGTLEIVVFTDYDARALPPESLAVGQAAIPSTGNEAGARPWRVYAANVGSDGWTASWGGTLWFVPDPLDKVHRGRMSVDLGAVLTSADRVLRDTYRWPSPARHYWLDTVSFGIEFGPRSADPYDSAPVAFSARISAFCLTAGGTLARAACA